MSDADVVTTYLHLSRLLDQVEHEHPDVSASLRLTLVRSHRRYAAGWLDAERFHEVLVELTSLGGSAPDLSTRAAG